MEGQGNFNTNCNYMFNSYDRISLSDIVDSPSEDNQSVLVAQNRQYSGNPVFPTMDIVGSHIQVGRQHSDYFGVSNCANFSSSGDTVSEQARRMNQLDSRPTVGNISNSFTHQRSIILSNCAEKDTVNSSEHKKRIDELSNIHKSVNVSVGIPTFNSVANVKIEQADGQDDTGNNREAQEVAVNDVSEKSDTEFNNDFVMNIKEEAVSDDENDGTEGHEENREDSNEQSDVSTVIEDEDEITSKLLDGKPKQPIKIQGKSNKSSKKKPRKQKMPKPVLSKDKKEYTCETCAKVVQSHRALVKHMNLHTENYKCKDCNKIFNSAVSLKNHCKVHAGYIGNEVCKVCDKTFYDKSSLKKHTLSVHMGITNFQCEYCQMSFFARKTYDEHVRVHTGEKPFKCSLCPKAYKRVADLNHHIRLHKGEVSHTCDKCGEGFRRVSELNRHMNSRHSDDDMTKTFINVNKEKKCQWCGLAFSTLKALNAHLSTHKLVDDMVHNLGTKPAVHREHGISVEKNIASLIPNISNNWANVSLPMVPVNYGSQGFLGQEMPMSQVLDMTYKSMKLAEPDKQLKSINQGSDSSASKTEEDKRKIYENEKSAKSYEKDFDVEFENSNSSIGNEEELSSEEIYTDNEGADSSSSNKDNNVDDIPHVKSEIEDDFIDDDPEIEVDDYDADTDIEEYNYVFHKKDDVSSDIAQGKLKELSFVKIEAVDSDCEGNDKKKDNLEKDPDFIPKVEKVSKRKATKPRKKVQKKKKVKQSSEISDTDDEEIAESKEETKATEEDDSLDLASLKCLLCGKTFSKKVSLKIHMNIHRGTFACKLCGKCFATKNSLKVHMDNHEGRRLKSAVCKVCDKVFYDASSVNKHVKTVHMDYRPYSCTVCDRRFPEHKTLNEHMRVHSGERPFACEVCGKTYKRTSELNFHIRKHNGEVNLNCPECGKGFIRVGQLRQHMLLKHDKERPFRCFICQKTFPTPVMLKDHRKMHVILKKHVCHKCGHKFNSKSKLDKHLRRKTDCQTDCGSTENGMFICKYCNEEFPKIEERYAHMREAHQTAEQRRHACEICGKTFHRNQALKIHLKIHYQVRDYKCTVCGAAFIQRHHLTQHIATHTGSRPYQCNVCFKSFAHSATLYNHMKHH